jgi:hypothetical protein
MSANNNSQIGFYTDVFMHLHTDVVGASAHVSAVVAARDRKTIRSRVRSEGLSFFTKTLPSFGKAIDKALSTDTPLKVPSFKRKKDSAIPNFLGWLLSEVFDDTGTERREACPVALSQARQLCYLFYKLELPYGDELNDKVIQDFLDTENDLAEDERQLAHVYSGSKFNKEVESIARYLISLILAGHDPARISPRHGPGSVATGEAVDEKRNFSRYYVDLAQFYPYEQYMYYNMTHVGDELSGLLGLEELEYGTAKVVLVPKDSRGPRLISCEPLEKQWIQQGQMRLMVDAIESHPLTSKHVNFDDQEVNRDLALWASSEDVPEGQGLATLDMKEASDRVSMELVERLFPTRWVAALKASRSSATELPDGRLVHLRKFAPMGSAVCFPVEALCFWALCAALVHVTRTMYRESAQSIKNGLRDNTVISQAAGWEDIALNPHKEAKRARRSVEKAYPGLLAALGSIYVYGDDIICRLEDHEAIRHYLPEFSLKVNEDKCCSGRSFRESCGCDAFKGIDVTPTKIRAEWSSSLHVRSYPAYVAYSNALYAGGYIGTALYIEGLIQKIEPTPYFDTESHDGIGFQYADVRAVDKNHALGLATRFSSRIHVPLVAGSRSVSCDKRTKYNGWEEMLRVASYKSCKGLDEAWSDLYHSEAPMPTNEEPEDLCKWVSSLNPLCITAGRYTIPRRNRLKRGWLRML